MSIAGKQNTSQYHRIQASVSRQAAASCGSQEKELRARHIAEAEAHEAQAQHYARVEKLAERAKSEAKRLADDAEQFLHGTTTPMLLTLLERAYLAGRIDALTEK